MNKSELATIPENLLKIMLEKKIIFSLSGFYS
jgi:hypothetical protein